MFEIGAEVMHGWPGMAKVIEEMGELQTIMAKIMSGKGDTIYWDESNLVYPLLDEIADVQAALWFFLTMNEGRLREETMGDYRGILDHRTRAKQDQFMEWHWDQLREDPQALKEQRQVDEPPGWIEDARGTAESHGQTPGPDDTWGPDPRC
jgi:hypothetical protein